MALAVVVAVDSLDMHQNILTPVNMFLGRNFVKFDIILLIFSSEDKLC